MASQSSTSRVLRLGGRPRVAAAREVHLARRQVVALRGDSRGTQVVAQNCVLWITQDGDAEDHILQPGQRLTIDGVGLVVIQGM